MNKTIRRLKVILPHLFATFPLTLSVWFLLSCSTTPAVLPEWAASPSGIRQIFPDSEYIAQGGRGATREAAEAQAAAEIARFFSSQITASKGYQISTNNTAETITTRDEAFVNAQIYLFGIRYAQDAFYRKDTNEWYTVAYIERKEAWTVYEPGFKRQADSFTALFTAAENETDSFKKVLRFFVVENFARAEEFENANLFGQILYPEHMNAEFAVVRSQIAAIPQMLDEGRRNASVYIDCPMDFENLIANAFASRFAEMGFPVSKTRTAAAVCAVTVDEGMQKRDLGIFYFPSLQAVITGGSGTLFTFSAEGERASAVTPDVAKRRAFQSLAATVTRTFSLNTNAL
jgi:hypothetical protein